MGTPSQAFRLEDLIEPFDRDHFIQQYWNREFLHLSGQPGRFEALFPWARLNEVLTGNRPRSLRLRLAHKGKIVDAREYVKTHAGELRISPQGFYEKLSQGATLIVDHAEELNPPLFDLASALEAWVRARVNVNLYASWRAENGFNLHWDPQDTFIVQIAGRKHWKVYRPTRDFAVQDEKNPAPQPSSEPVFDGLLEAGSLLYVPRGWWHLATPIGEPCLHLTVTFNLHRGADLLRWAVDRFQTQLLARQDLPIFATLQEQAQYTENLFREFAASTDASMFQEFLDLQDAATVGLPQFQLPEFVEPEYRPSLRSEIQFVAPRHLQFSLEGDVASVKTQNQVLAVPARLWPAIHLLCLGDRVAVATMLDFDGVDEAELLALLAAWARRGLLKVS
jgi:ribosomal protein L16 Arg81 hydroxylase